MSKIFRALLISAAATGAAIVVASRVGGKKPDRLSQTKDRPTGPAEIEADRMSPEEAEALMRELGAQL